MILYRFRSIEALIGSWQELERQQIYLSSPEQLNDPLEGHKEFVWVGDAVLWSNLLRHYLLCLFHATMHFTFLGRDDASVDPVVHPLLTDDDLPSLEVKKLFGEVTRGFFSDPAVIESISLLSQLDPALRSNGVTLLLSFLHPVAVKYSFSAVPGATFPMLHRGEDLSGSVLMPILAVIRSMTHSRDKSARNLGAMADVVELQLESIRLEFRRRMQTGALSPWMDFLLLDFPSKYVEQIAPNLMHPGWQTACFTRTCTNSLMWATYGDDHKGVALRFRAEHRAPNHLVLPVKCVTGWASGPPGSDGHATFGERDYQITEVQYGTDPPEVDFFKFIGQLPWPKLRSQWHTDRDGNISRRITESFADEDQWREQLWRLTNASRLRKSNDWKHEQELRIVSSDILGLHANHRYLEYRFENLSGIVFGIRTPNNEKTLILEVLKRKCSRLQRSDLEILQARYARRSREIEAAPIGFV